MVFNFIKNKFSNGYRNHPEAVIISCYFNPQNSSYRLKAFNNFYDSIKPLNHLIVECIIGDSEPQLEDNENIVRYQTRNLLWHKETLLNKAVSQLPDRYKYIFWVDADVLFTNLDWLVSGVKELQSNNIIQPFEYCAHLERDELEPSFDLDELLDDPLPNEKNNKVWRSFCANFADTKLWQDTNYNRHGHVGFAWGARREVLEAVSLYDKALIGGADHIIAHAAAGQIPHPCISKSFTDNLQEVEDWSRRFYRATEGKIGYVPGNLYHLWHGDITKREYLPRIQRFTKSTQSIIDRDESGFWETEDLEIGLYVEDYFDRREVSPGEDGGGIDECPAPETSDECLAPAVDGAGLESSALDATTENNICETFS
jgi:hypothetical protein